MAKVSLPRPSFFLTFLSTLLLVFSSHPAQAATLPSNFIETPIATGLLVPTAMEFAPDGRLFVAEQGGTLRVIDGGVLQPTPFVTLNVNSTGERGLLGIAFDPNFATNHFVYVYYTTATSPIHNRVSRFVASGNVASGAEQVILNLENLTATNHNGGAIHFGPDGKLYVAVGENAVPSNAQTLNNRLGKILRINPNGSIPSDNPFFNTATGVNRSIWALGLRNPFTFAFQRNRGRMFINDVGAQSWEEINDGIAGSNYGWPTTEGETTSPNFRSPLFAYGHGSGNTLGCAIAGGAFYNPNRFQFPLDYQGDYFFADLCSNWIRRYDIATDTVIPFATSTTARPVDLKVGNEGNLYYLVRGSGSNTGAVYRVHYRPDMGDTLALYNTSNGVASLVNKLIDRPPASAFSTYTPNAPVVAQHFVMGDWNGDGQKTPGIFHNRVFRYTNSIGPSTSWSAVRIGAFSSVYPVAGRFDPAVNHDCFGIVQLDSGTPNSFPLRYQCDLSVLIPPGGLHQQQLNVTLPGSAPYQFVAGDWNNDGLDSIAVRRGNRITFGNVAPAQGQATFPMTQVIGNPRTGNNLVVAGDWDNNGADSFGLFYPQDGFFYRRNDLDLNSGVYVLQRVGVPIGTTILVDSWRSGGQTSLIVPSESLEIEVTEEATEVVTPEATEAVTPEMTETAEATAFPFPTVTLTPFPTLELPPPPTNVLPSPTATPTEGALPLPAFATMDDGAPDWQASAGWALTATAAYGGQGLGWQAIAANQTDTLRWTRGLDLRPILMGQKIELSYQSLLSSAQSSAQVQVSVDMTNWATLATATAWEQWTTESIDLSAYAGQVIYVQFVWNGVVAADIDQPVDYWLIDNVQAQAFPAEATGVATGTPSATVIPSATALPSVTAIPSATVLPPTVTEMPTLTPSPTETAVTEPIIPQTEEAAS